MNRQIHYIYFCSDVQNYPIIYFACVIQCCTLSQHALTTSKIIPAFEFFSMVSRKMNDRGARGSKGKGPGGSGLFGMPPPGLGFAGGLFGMPAPGSGAGFFSVNSG